MASSINYHDKQWLLSAMSEITQRVENARMDYDWDSEELSTVIQQQEEAMTRLIVDWNRNSPYPVLRYGDDLVFLPEVSAIWPNNYLYSGDNRRQLSVLFNAGVLFNEPRQMLDIVSRGVRERYHQWRYQPDQTRSVNGVDIPVWTNPFSHNFSSEMEDLWMGLANYFSTQTGEQDDVDDYSSMESRLNDFYDEQRHTIRCMCRDRDRLLALFCWNCRDQLDNYLTPGTDYVTTDMRDLYTDMMVAESQPLMEYALPDEDYDDQNRLQGNDDHGEHVERGEPSFWAAVDPQSQDLCVVCLVDVGTMACQLGGDHIVCYECVVGIHSTSVGLCPVCRRYMCNPFIPTGSTLFPETDNQLGNLE